ncbi:hypothetical protein DES52_1305 [Deinococcus yavapaiensis KR-236]|uniref:Uncharacterized protein n=1 Tax=Deinococcus yavapaiensis KR-236 TaxID=694435 RepID=A0A318SBS1_9DEIO|nr:hypothetical protein DES52_1305 [Deinococcus yavapaiensis KR-236]
MRRTARQKLEALRSLALLDVKRGHNVQAALNVLDALSKIGVKGGQA